jgi:hypothetical protein
MSSRAFVDATREAAHPETRAAGERAALCAQLRRRRLEPPARRTSSPRMWTAIVGVFAGEKLEALRRGPSAMPPAVGAVALTNDGKTAITSGRDQVVRVWNVETGEALAALPHDSFVEVLALAPG